MLVRILIALVVTIVAWPAAAQVPALLEVPADAIEPNRSDLAGARRNLLVRLSNLRQQVQLFNAQCDKVIKGSAADAQCQQKLHQLEGVRTTYVADAESFNAKVRSAKRYQASGSALIGGTTWAIGYNVQTADPKVVEKAREVLKRQMELAGLNFESVDVERFNFVLGVAHSTEATWDLLARVRRDESTDGQFSASQQAAYAALKGRSFVELACHSNGAMVCLAALSRKDIVAKKVVLYGPQITLDSLQMWEKLMKSKQIETLEIHINNGDPVPPVSLLWTSSPAKQAAMTVMLAPLLLTSAFLPGNAASIARVVAPSASVTTAQCGVGIDLKCHSMTTYRSGAHK